MSSTSDPLPRDALSRMIHWRPLMLAALVFLVAYGVEIVDFGLSIDEEAATYVTDTPRIALAQGRWGMSLVMLCLPNIGAIPMVSTLLFGCGLLFATWRAFADFRLDRHQSYAFAAVHVAFPIWLHIVQFSTIAGIVGIGLAAAVTGARLAMRGTLVLRLLGALLIAFAVSVYQTLGLYCALYILLSLHAEFVARGRAAIPARRLLATGATLAAGLVLYVLIQKVGLAASGATTAYIERFVQVDRLRTEPRAAIHDILDYVWQLIGGRHAAYLGWGVALLLLSWIGLLPIPARRTDGPAITLRRWMFTLAAASLGIALLAVPTIMSVATLPLRAYVVLPLLAAWLASRPSFTRGSPLALAHAALVAYFVVVASSLGARLFYTDQVVHNADAALSTQLMAAIDRAAAKNGLTDPVPVSLVGSHSFPFAGEIARAEQFGASFYEQDNGNVYRMAYYMQLQGHAPLEAIWLGHRPNLLPAARAMPAWPADGSVQVVDGVVLVKLGPPTKPQLKTD